MVYVTEDRSGFFEDGNGNDLDDGGECDGPAIWSAAADGGNLPDSAVSCPFFSFDWDLFLDLCKIKEFHGSSGFNGS